MHFLVPYILVFLALAFIYGVADYLLRGKIEIGYVLVFSALPFLAGLSLILSRQGLAMSVTGLVIALISVAFGFNLLLKPGESPSSVFRKSRRPKGERR